MSIMLRTLPPSARRDCVTGIMPTCLESMFTGLTSDQQHKLATAMITNINAALRRTTP